MKQRSPLRVLTAVCIVAAGVCFIVSLYVIGLSKRDAANRDFIEYWAAGQQLVHGANPYDIEAILRREKAAGLEKDSPKVTFSPPLVLLLAWPLGYFDAKTGLILWLLASLGCLVASMGILRLLYGGGENGAHLIGYAFPPALASLMAGQLSIFFLFEIAIFLYFHEKRPWLAGASLVLYALKPHLFLPAAVVLLLWSVSRHRFSLLGGFLGALCAGCVICLCLDRHVWSQYEQMLISTRIMDLFLPTVSVAFRFLVDRHARWLEFLPEVAGCAWAGWYFWKRRKRWDWLYDGPLVLLVSLVCAPYSWYSDQAVLLPAIFIGLYQAGRSIIPLALFGLIAGAGFVGVLAQIPLPSAFYVWTAPAWLLWYLYTTKCAQRCTLSEDVPIG
jgi:Glycosyltransferase family 87